MSERFYRRLVSAIFEWMSRRMAAPLLFHASPPIVAGKPLTADDCAARIAHDINGPLGSIRNAVALLKDSTPEEAAEWLAVIESEVDRISQAVRSTLAVRSTRSEAPSTHEDLSGPTSSADLLRSITEATEAAFAIRGVQLTTVSSGKSFGIPFEPLVRHALFSFVLHALSRADGEQQIQLRLDRVKDALIFEILWRPGDIPDVREIAFFSKNTKVSGVMPGLAYESATAIVVALGGEVLTQSAERRESSIVFRLPIKPDASEL